MRRLAVRIPEALAADIAAESRERKVSKSDVIRQRLSAGARRRSRRASGLESIADLVGSVDRLPSDLSARRKYYVSV